MSGSRLFGLALAMATALAAACASSGRNSLGSDDAGVASGSGSTGSGGAGSGGSTGSSGTSGFSGSSGSGGSTGSGSSSGSPASSGDGGSCTTTCGGGQVCVNGTCACPAYQSFCGGMCIPTSVDPNNCGACGNACTGAMACSGGTCATSCAPGLTLCANDHTCADTSNDNGHCGSCTTACPTGQACVAGACVPTTPLTGTPPSCAGGGPPIVNPPGQGGCLGGLGATTFTWTLCSCKDVRLSDLILVDAFNSAMGPPVPGGVGGGVGADNVYHSSASSVQATGGGIYGDLWASSPMGIDDSAPELIEHELRCGGPLHTSATMSIGADTYANGDVSGGVAIAGKLYTTPSASVSVTPAGGIVRGSVAFPPPCDCAPNQLVPVTAIVQAHASPNNDDAAIGLNQDVLATSPSVRTRLDLPCGSYYLSSIHSSVAVTIWAHGQTALYIGGDVQTSDDIAFGVDPTGAFDVFIEGKLDTSARLHVGSPNYPALSRMYIGSATGLTLSSTANIGGNIYAAYGPVSWSASTDAFGSVFAGDFSASSATRIHYDTAILNSGSNCPTPDGGAGDSGVPGCGSCRDCMNQACINGQCGACGSSADCCPPLVCSNGTCVPVNH